jgi:hypothetical protein
VDAATARTLLREILASGRLWYSRHATDKMARDQLTTVDLVNVLRAGAVEPSEFEHGSWRHRVKTNRICVVVVLVSAREAVVVTTWRLR